MRSRSVEFPTAAQVRAVQVLVSEIRPVHIRAAQVQAVKEPETKFRVRQVLSAVLGSPGAYRQLPGDATKARRREGRREGQPP